jgi:nitrile hydratase
MNGAHDMGGTHGFGAVQPDETSRGGCAPLFETEWERRVFGLTLAMGATGAWNIDASRHARENQAPADYLAKSYFQVWLHGLERLMLDAGLVTRSELESGRAEAPAKPLPRVLTAEAVGPTLARGGPSARETNRAPAFALGDRVVAKVMAPAGHTRLPRYVRGRPGRIVLLHGAHVFPDSNGHFRGEDPQHLYTVAFDARDIWGQEAFGGEVRVDCWEPYLERAERGRAA